MKLTFERGSPLPFGASLQPDGVNFAIFAGNATDVALVLFDPPRPQQVAEVALDSLHHKTGDVWHIFVRGLPPTFEYCYRIDRYPNTHTAHLHRFDPGHLLLDPYSKAVTGSEQWGVGAETPPLRRSALPRNDFDWGDDQPLNIALADSILYEMHVRGFTKHNSSHVTNPGTFAGVIEKIPYLQDLGITAIELLPVYEFEEANADRSNPFTGERLLNYWGYQPISFFALKSALAADQRPSGPANEFKRMVKALHAAGIEVILDVVFNHTAEGDHRGPTYSYRGIDNSVYYMLEPDGRYRNYSGCGNTLNCNHPVVRSMINNCLRYWVMEMHVDGFRFDLASILGRGRDGSVLANPPLLEALAFDPILANTKLIAEAWDAAGLYQVGTFPAWGRWAEWNGRFRDDLRRFLKGDANTAATLAERILGSPDIYSASGRQAHHSINYITCHDGFTLADLVAYNHKHNDINGEDNRDGMDENHSWNCGEEGPSDNAEVNTLRLRQQKNAAALLLLSGGVPMILAGDELGRTQLGNNNAYCQDNEISWIDWSLLRRNQELYRFFKLMIAFRKQHEGLRRINWPCPGEPHQTHVLFHGASGTPDWSWESRSLAVQWTGNGENIYLIANSFWEQVRFHLPDLHWLRVADTSLHRPHDIVEPGHERQLRHRRHYDVAPRSVVLLIAGH